VKLRNIRAIRVRITANHIEPEIGFGYKSSGFSPVTFATLASILGRFLRYREKQKLHQGRDIFPIFQPVGNDSQCQGLGMRNRVIGVFAVGQHAGKFLYFCQPAAILFLFVLNGKFRFDFLSVCVFSIAQSGYPALTDAKPNPFGLTCAPNSCNFIQKNACSKDVYSLIPFHIQ